MPRGSKAAYSSKQRREARHIEESYEDRGISSKEAARRAWATVNKQTGGAAGKKDVGAKETAAVKTTGAKKTGATKRAGSTNSSTRKRASAKKATTTRRTGARKSAAKTTRRSGSSSTRKTARK